MSTASKNKSAERKSTSDVDNLRFEFDAAQATAKTLGFQLTVTSGGYRLWNSEGLRKFPTIRLVKSFLRNHNA